MAILSTDLILYTSANMPDTDTGTNGGAIDPLRRPDFTQLAANDDLEAVSSNAGDTMNLTIEGRDAAGNVVSETKALTGTSAVIFSTISVIERVLKAELASAPAGSVTVRRSVAGATVRVIPAGERGFMMFFRKTSVTRRCKKTSTPSCSSRIRMAHLHCRTPPLSRTPILTQGLRICLPMSSRTQQPPPIE